MNALAIQQTRENVANVATCHMRVPNLRKTAPILRAGSSLRYAQRSWSALVISITNYCSLMTCAREARKGMATLATLATFLAATAKRVMTRSEVWPTPSSADHRAIHRGWRPIRITPDVTSEAAK